MNTKYTLTGMTCGGCEAKVKSVIETIQGVLSATVDRESNSVKLVHESPKLITSN